MKNRIAQYITKDNQVASFESCDIELQTNLEELLKKVYCKTFGKSDNTDLADWMEEDYKNFVLQLKRCYLSIYQKMYPYINYLITLSKEEIKQELLELDSRLETHVFDDERVLVNSITENNQVTQNYEFRPHSFDCGDIIRFVTALYSKLLQTTNFSFQKYKSNLLNLGSLQERQEHLNLILDDINQQDPQTIAFILNPYYSYIVRACNHSYLYSLLQGKEAEIISIFQSNIAREIAIIQNRQDIEIKKYNIDFKNKISNYQLKRDIYGRKKN